MTARQLRWVVALWSAGTAAALIAGFDEVGAVAALFLTCGLVGAPLAVLAGRRLQPPAVVVLAVTVSVAETALVSQALVWMSWAAPAAIVVGAGAYGVALSLLVERHGAVARVEAT